MICALQDATSAYVNGKDSIEDGLVHTFNLYHMELSTELILPHLFFFESELGVPTDIRVEDVFRLCTKRVEKIIGTTL